MLKAGIVGLPNVGKSTLFNAVVRSRKAEAANYPFCTIDPNMGAVTVPDPRLEQIAQITHSKAIIPTTIEFVDIAGLVRGASRGEGRGNKFLSHIREVDAIIQVVRCFDDPDVVHVAGTIDPIRDIEIVATELELADLESVHRRSERVAKETKHGDKTALAEASVLKKLAAHLDAGRPASTVELAPEEKAIAKGLFLLTAKPTVFAANVHERDLAAADTNPHILRVREYARSHHGCDTVAISAKIEADLVDLTPEEGREFLREMGVPESGVDALIRSTYRVLELRTFFTTNEKEVRAWTIHAGDTAPKAAGQVHTDFEHGFIRAESVSAEDLFACGSFAHAREKGLYRVEGKDYVVRDGDILLFRFHV